MRAVQYRYQSLDLTTGLVGLELQNVVPSEVLARTLDRGCSPSSYQEQVMTFLGFEF